MSFGTTNLSDSPGFKRYAALRCATGLGKLKLIMFRNNSSEDLTCWISVNSILSAAIGRARRAGARQLAMRMMSLAR